MTESSRRDDGIVRFLVRWYSLRPGIQGIIIEYLGPRQNVIGVDLSLPLTMHAGVKPIGVDGACRIKHDWLGKRKQGLIKHAFNVNLCLGGDGLWDKKDFELCPGYRDGGSIFFTIWKKCT